MKLSLPALLDAGRRFTAGLAMSRPPRRPLTQQQAQQLRRGFFLLEVTLACFLAVHPPALHAADWRAQAKAGTIPNRSDRTVRVTANASDAGTAAWVPAKAAGQVGDDALQA